jgi:hypothetical protein
MATVRKKVNPRRNIVGERVKEARRQFTPPLTQDQLSGKLASEGVQLDRVAIAKVESGLRSVFDFEVRALASVLRVDVKWLLGMDGGTSQRSRKNSVPGKVRA